MSIESLVPDPQALLNLEDSELGAVMLEHLNGLPPYEASKFTFASHFREDCLTRYPRDLQGQASKCLAEGWMWLQREGLIAQDPDDNYAMWYFVTRRGSRLRTREHVAAFARASILPKALLHPIIAAKAERPFLRGEYDTAVFQAFKEFEVLVRQLSKCSEADYGTELMRKAFHESTGPLTDMSVPVSERQALAHLCAGAIGSYKNPHSHRNVAIDAREAVEMLIIASHLIRIAEERSTNP